MANYMFKMFRHVKMHVWYVESHVTDMVLTCNMYRHVPLHGVFWWPIDHQGAPWLYLQYCRDKSNTSKEESNTNAFRFSSIIHEDRYRFMKINIYGSAARRALLGGAFSPSEMWASSKVYPRDPQRARRAAHPPNKYGFHPSTFSDFDTNKPV